MASTSGRKSSKRGKAAHGDVVETAVEDPGEDIGDDIVQFDSKTDAAGALILQGPLVLAACFIKDFTLWTDPALSRYLQKS